MRLIFLPAMGPDAIENPGTVNPINWLDPRLRGTPAYHPHILTAYPAWGHQRFRWEPQVFVFGDSGGYSLMTRGLVIDPVAVIRWQLRFCTVGVILDVPPFADDERGLSVGFDEGLRRSTMNLQAALPTYRAARVAGHAFRWWGVIQGRTRDEMARWWSTLARAYPFDEDREGWAFKPHPMNSVEAVARYLRFAGEHGIRRLHLLGTCAPLPVEAASCMGPPRGFELVTFDSSTPLKSANLHDLIVTGPYGREYRREHGLNHVRTFMRTQCPCQSCRFIDEDFRDDPALSTMEAYWVRRRAFHNVLAVLADVQAVAGRYAADIQTSAVLAKRW